jgi:hypothetical protein
MTITRGRVNITPETSFMSTLPRAVDNIHYNIGIIYQTLLQYFIEHILDNYFRTLPIATNSAGRPMGRISNPGRGKIFLLSTSSRPIPEPTHPPIQWTRGGVVFPGNKAVGTWS